MIFDFEIEHNNWLQLHFLHSACQIVLEKWAVTSWNLVARSKH